MRRYAYHDEYPGAGKGLLSPKVAKDGRVTFRIVAANAKDVMVAGGFTAKSLPMTKDDLESKMNRHRWELTQGGLHNWLVWRPYLRDVLTRLFKE